MLRLFPVKKNLYHFVCLTTACISAVPLNAFAQSADQDDIAESSEAEDDLINEDIVVTADRIRGSVISEIPPVAILTEDDIASYGASSVSELLAALAPQTGSARGRGSGPPIVLINAQRVSGFRELRNIPPEAIVRVEILPEEVALQYGFKPDQRVINFILKDNFSSIDINGGAGLSTSGGYHTTDIGSTYTKFSKNSRFNADIDFEQTSTLTEDERNIIQDDNGFTLAGPIGTQDIGQFRTLLPNSDQLEITAVYSRNLSVATNISGNIGYTYRDSLSLFGLNNPILTVPQSNQFNATGADQIVQRFFTEPRPLQSTSQSDSFEGGVSINSRLGRWQLSSSANADYFDGGSQIDQNGDFIALQQLLLDDDNVNIFADIIDPSVGPVNFITSNIKTTNITNLNTISGTLFTIPNGEVSTTFRGGYNYSRIDSDSDQSGVNINTILSRNIFSLGGNIDIPLTDRGVGIGRILGKISLNGNAGIDDVSDFGTLTEYGFGVTWKPIDDLTLSFTSINEDSPPTIAQLGNPITVTPNVPIFDFAQSQTSFVQLTTGGNPNLLAERQRDIKISLNYSPNKISGLNFIADYTRNRSFDTSNNFPLLTPEIEAAFQDRVVRDANGTLLALDRTPVVFDRVASERIRYGFNFSKSLGGRGGRPPGAGGGRPTGAAGPPSGVPAGASSAPRSESSTNSANGGNNESSETVNNTAVGETSESQARGAPSSRRPSGVPSGVGDRPANSGEAAPGRPTGDRPGGAAGGRSVGATGGGPPQRPGRYNISLFHTVALDETILIRPDVAELDLLDGSAIGNNGGAARHQIELEGGIFNDGLGARVTGNFRSATTVDGDILTGSSDLRFGSLATIDLRIFYNIDSRPNITKTIPFLKGSRISLSVDNVFNAIQNITNLSGDVPINFQRGFIDPRGRFVQLRFRKRF